MGRPWYATFPPVRVGVPCGGADHHLTWRKGALCLDDHDLGAEVALEALGGDPVPCVAVLRAWRAVCGSPRPLSAWGETAQLGSHAATPRAGPMRAQLDALPGPLHDVVAAASLVRAQRHAARGDAVNLPAQLHRLVAERFTDALRASLRPVRACGVRTDVRYTVRVTAVGEPPSVEVQSHRTGVRLEVGLSLGWLVEVWGRGAACVDGRLVLRMHPPGGLAMRWDVVDMQPEPALVAVSLRRDHEGTWHATDESPTPASGQGAWWSVRRLR